MRLIRNHADAVVARKKISQINNLIGFNFRMGEIEAAIGIEQLKKLDNIIKSRKNVASELSKGIKDLKFLRTPHIPKDRDHVHFLMVDEIGLCFIKVA